MLPSPNASSLLNSSDRQKSSQSVQSDRSKNDQLSITVEVVTLDIPNPEVLSQAFEKIRCLENYLKPIVMEGLAKKLKVSKKTLDKAFEAWVMERITQTTTQNNQNSEEI